MIRTTDSETFIWFQCASRPQYKITWTVEQYLAYAKVSESESEERRLRYDNGVISELTDADRQELQYGGLTVRQRAVQVGAKAAGK